MRTVLICQEDAPLSRVAMARWLGSFSELAGIIVIRETGGRRWKRIAREAHRVGWLRLLDVMAFRLFQRVFLAEQDRRFERLKLDELCVKYPPLAEPPPELMTDSPNSAPSVEFLTRLAPDVVIASCKHILRPKVFNIPRSGAFALHPGICPEYRNAHGCFWALAQGDVGNVGATLLRIDAGVDTGPICGYFKGPYDELRESHSIIQRRMTFDHLDEIAAKLLQVHEGSATPIDVTGRTSAEWGQPWLTAYFRWKRNARRRRGGGLTNTSV